MKRLVYGIGLASGDWQRPLPLGPQRSAVDLVCEGELAAAFSGVVDSSVSPATPFLVAYAQVIAQLHRRGAILPMRYGCLLEGDASIRDLLRARRSEFLKALAEVDGCDEFGLRVLFDEKARPTQTSAYSTARSLSALSPSRGAGATYLAERNKRYAEKDLRRDYAADEAERCGAAFEKLFVRCERDPDADTASMASLHFLVRRENHSRFQTAFRELQQASRDRFLMTGPWPPYHFAAIGGSTSQARGGGLPVAALDAVDPAGLEALVRDANPQQSRCELPCVIRKQKHDSTTTTDAVTTREDG
jgi:hypothetical protein